MEDGRPLVAVAIAVHKMSMTKIRIITRTVSH